ncbi:CHAT domain-containing protein [Amycolatopsis sp. NPDC004378]
MAAVEARISAYLQGGDLGPLLEDEAVSETYSLLDTMTGHEDFPVLRTAGLMFWYRHRATPDPGEATGSRRAAISLLWPVFMSDRTALPAAVAGFLGSTGGEFARSAAVVAELKPRWDVGDRRALDEAIEAGLAAFRCEIEDDLELPDLWFDLGSALMTRYFERRLDASDATMAVKVFRQAAAASRTEGQQHYATSYGAAILLELYDSTGQPEHLAGAVEAFATVRAAGASTTGDLVEFGQALVHRFEAGGEPSDLDDATAVLTEAWRSAESDDDRRDDCLRWLGAAHAARFGVTGSHADLRETMRFLHYGSRYDESVDPAPHEVLLSVATSILENLQDQPHSTSGFDRVAIMLGAALRAAPENHQSLVEVLGAVLMERYAHTGHPAQLDRARRALRDERSAGLSESWAEPLLRAALSSTAVPETDLATIRWAARVTRFLGVVMPVHWKDRALAGVALADYLRNGYEASGLIEELDEAITTARDAWSERDPGDLGVSQLAGLLALRAERTGRADVDEAIGMLAAAPDTQRVRAALGPALLQRWELGHDADDARQALTVMRQVVAETPERDLNRVNRVTNLAAALQVNYRVSRDDEHLDEAIDLYRTVVEATPERTPHHLGRVYELGRALYRRGLDRDDAVAASEAVVLFRRVVDHDVDAWRVRAFDDLIAALDVARARTGDPDLLREMLDRLRDIGDDPAFDDETRLKSHEFLGTTLLRRYDRTADLTDLDAVIDTLKTAVATPTAAMPERLEVLDLLGVALRVRCERNGLEVDSDAAVDTHRAALEGTEVTSAERVHRLAALGLTLCSRFEVTHAREDVDDALILLRQAAAALPADDDELPRTLSDLGVVLMRRFGVTNDQAELDEAIDLQRRAIAAAGLGHPDLTRRLLNLAGPLRLRYSRFGRLADLDEAINALRTAVADESYRAGERPELQADLGVSLRARARRTDQDADFDEAETHLLAALAALPEGHAIRPKVLSGLATVRLLRARRTEPPNQDLLGEAIALGQAAVEAGNPDHYQYQDSHGNLAAALATRYLLTEDRRDGTRAIAILRELVDGTGSGADRSNWLINLGHCLAVTAGEDENDYAAALAAYREVTISETTPADLRCDAGRSWGRLAGRRHDWAAAVTGYSRAIELLPLAVARGLHRSDQEFKLRAFAGLAPDAAACAIRAGDPELALELLEHGRGVLLAQAFETRDDISDLERSHPELARRFVALRTQLDAPSTEFGRDNDRLHRLAEECNAVVAEIRALPGRQRFLKPPSTDDILRAVPAGAAAAVLNASQFGFDALIVTAGELRLVPLTTVDDETLRRRTTELNAAIRLFHAQSASYDIRVSTVDKVVEVLGWLWDVVAERVLRHLGPTSSPLPRLWWVPTGPFVQLPLHASGRHDEPGDRTALDRVVSSYALTLRSLVRGEQRRALSGNENAIVVSATEVPGYPRLTAGEAEAAVAATHLPDARLLARATPGSVLAALDTATHAHFACHATVDLDDPSAGHLVLHDGSLSISDIAARHSKHASFAYLSACDTSRTSDDLADESIHLSSAFQLAGFQHVIAALWPLSDATARDIAELVYSGLAVGPALALHEAIRTLRDNDPGDIVNWIAPIHSGI